MKFLIVGVLFAVCIAAYARPQNEYGLFDNIFRANLDKQLTGIDASLVGRKDLQAIFVPEIEALREEARTTDDLALTKSKVTSLANAILEAKKTPPARNQYAAYSAASELYDIFARIKKIILTDFGLSEIREYARSLESDHSVVFLIKMFLEITDDETLADMLEDMFSGIEAANYRGDVDELAILFLRAKEIVDTDEGLAVVKQYVENLKPSNELVIRIRGFILGASDEVIREVLDELFGGLTLPSYRTKWTKFRDGAVKVVKEIIEVIIKHKPTTISPRT